MPLDSLLTTVADGGLGRRNRVSASPQEKVTGSLLERKLHNLHSLNVGNNVTFLTLSIMEDVTIQRLSEKSELLVVILYNVRCNDIKRNACLIRFGVASTAAHLRREKSVLAAASR